MRAAQVDASIKILMLAQMIKMTIDEGDSVVLPNSARVQWIDRENYNKRRETLGGLTGENELTVCSKLQALGIIPGAGL